MTFVPFSAGWYYDEKLDASHSWVKGLIVTKEKICRTLKKIGFFKVQARKKGSDLSVRPFCCSIFFALFFSAIPWRILRVLVTIFGKMTK